ncbi:MAG: RHS repeat protein, partial [Methylobacteriaceae bacterium]|nr:RHS repeat protein [Methylobacteriaceae bacterium]
MTSANSETFGYWPTGRLNTASGPYGSYTWLYDAVGNRASETLGGIVTTYNYPTNSNQLTSLTQGSTTLRSLGYDGDGNITSDT